ncbi:unnamed protein product [Trichobilharzia regenti]|nr:unnamed protein product [Trichobilharzia regenti]
MHAHSMIPISLLCLICCLVSPCVTTWLVRSGETVREANEFPFIALMITDVSMCTATLVSTKAIITAGHCVCGPKSINRVSMSLCISFQTLSDFDKRSVNYQVASIEVAPEYDPVCQMKRARQRTQQSFGGYDIAIVTLSEMVDMSTGVKVISLATESDIPVPNSVVYIVGYGRDSKATDDTRLYGGVLKKGELLPTQ